MKTEAFLGGEYYCGKEIVRTLGVSEAQKGIYCINRSEEGVKVYQKSIKVTWKCRKK